MGGWDGTNRLNDVWASEDGVNWVEITASANWEARNQQFAVVFDNKMWIGAGSTTIIEQDAWYSSNGLQWFETAPNTIWDARAYPSSYVLNDKLWIFGGWTGAHSDDVWSIESLYPEDTTAPENHSIQINDGDSSTDSNSVTITLTAFDQKGITGYYLSESDSTPDLSDSGWVNVTESETFMDEISFTLTTDTGLKTVCAWFKDAEGNVSSEIEDVITLEEPSCVTTHLSGYWGDAEWGNKTYAEDNNWSSASTTNTANKLLYVNYDYSGQSGRSWRFKYSTSGSQWTVFLCWDYTIPDWIHVYDASTYANAVTQTATIPSGCLQSGSTLQLQVMSASSASYYEGEILCE